MSTTVKETLFTSTQAEVWFDYLIDKINKDYTELRTGLASKEKEDFYSAFISGSQHEMIKQNRNFVMKYYISRILFEYMNEIKEQKISPIKLAFDYSDSKVLVWAEIDNESVEDKLILTQAKINDKYSKEGFCVSTTIVEKEDGLNIPNHYKKIE
jgi:hypothetical protein